MIRAFALLLAIAIVGAALANDGNIARRLAAADARDGQSHFSGETS
ncbi:hypothetical protein [Dongia sp.]